MIGTLVHITSAKKLMIKISEETYDNIYNRLYNECKKKKYPTDRLAVYSRENDDGQEEHFAMVTPDKYDKLNMPKFERLLRKEVNFSTRMKPYDFIPDGETEQSDAGLRRQGINLELIRIHQRVQKQPNACVGKQACFPVGEVDEIADKAAARACSKETELNRKTGLFSHAEEQAAAAPRRRRTVAKEASLTALEAQIALEE